MKIMKLLSVSVTIILIYLSDLSFGEDEEFILEIPDIGKVQGDRKFTTNNDSFISFYDIPYAVIEENGFFKPAVRSQPSKEIINPNMVSSCPSVLSYYSESELDDYRKCLVLKIDTKNVTRKSPVIVYIPGADLDSGNTQSAIGEKLLTKDVILITIQYRIGALGFLSTSTSDYPGNLGVLDIIEALKWIQKYIVYFGGDPNRITLNGEYLTAGLIGILASSPMSEGLFHQIIYQSGSIELNDFITDQPQIIASQVAKELQCENSVELKEITDCFKKTDIGNLTNAYHTVWERYHGSVYQITANSPIPIYKWENSPRKYPTLGGFVDHPSIYVAERMKDYSSEQPYSRYSLNEKYKEKAENTLKLLRSSENNKSSKVEAQLYGENALISQFNITNSILESIIKGYLPYEIDETGLPIKLSVVKALYDNYQLGGDSYLFIFRYKSASSYAVNGGVLKNFVTINDDYQHLYSRTSSWDEIDDKEQFISDILIDIWTSFATTGIPSSPKITLWPKLSSPNGPYLIVDTNPYIGFNVTREFTPTINCQKDKTCQWIDL